MRHPGRDLQEALSPAVPDDHARQTLADDYIGRGLGRRADGVWRVLDLGCGPGQSVDAFRARDPDVDWVGIDLPNPHEAPTRTDARFETFDGLTIPFAENEFDLVYCKQVLEHVRDPAHLLGEVHRVLGPGGFFAGSTSQLEPYHTRSFWNYTPFGLRELLQDAGLTAIEFRPGIDGLALVSRRLFPRGRPFDNVWARWWGRQSPLNRLIDIYARLRGFDERASNATKLVLCGQFAFLARREE